MNQKAFHVKDMTCVSCEKRIEAALLKLDGVKTATASYKTSTVSVSFDEALVSEKAITSAIEAAGYSIGAAPNIKMQILGFFLIALLILGFMRLSNSFNSLPDASEKLGYGMLFVVGILTSFHCIAMCGGINLSQCLKPVQLETKPSRLQLLKPSLSYNLGRVVSYTIIGGIIGAIGSVFNFSTTAKSLITIFAGVIMFLMAINMLGIFPSLKRFMPRLPRLIKSKGSTAPFVVGLLNGLMPCGPLQTMQLYALGTGSFSKGALSMFFFSLGTVPLMFGFGALSSLLSKNFNKTLVKISASFIMVLAVIMIGRGLVLSGIAMPKASSASATANTAKGTVSGNVQTVKINLEANSYAPITVQKGVPVKFIINAAEENLNGCNSGIIIPEYNVQKTLEPGENVIEFTPTKVGTFPYSCWMGMITSSITVVDDVKNAKTVPAATKKTNTTPFKGCCGN